MITESEYRVRPPAVAEAFYPGGSAALARLVAGLLDGARGGACPALRGLVAPHAGYPSSGPIAGAAFAALAPAVAPAPAFRRAVLIGPAHFVAFAGLAAPGARAFRTPLGDVPVEPGAVAALADARLAAIDDVPHAPEHALEVELPFLQALLGPIPIVPLLFGRTGADRVAEAIGRLWDPETLLVVSSDLSHYEPYAEARAHDLRTAEAIEALDEAAIGPGDACGHLAIRGALIEAKRQGLAVARLDLRSSGDTAGDRARVVGYGAWAFVPAA